MSIRTVIDNTPCVLPVAVRLDRLTDLQQSRALTEVLFQPDAGCARVSTLTPMLVRAEIDDLMRRDIPYFTPPDRCDLGVPLGRDGRRRRPAGTAARPGPAGHRTP